MNCERTVFIPPAQVQRLTESLKKHIEAFGNVHIKGVSGTKGFCLKAYSEGLFLSERGLSNTYRKQKSLICVLYLITHIKRNCSQIYI